MRVLHTIRRSRIAQRLGIRTARRTPDGGVIRRIRTVPVLAGAFVLATGMTVFAPTTAQAAVACNETALVDAINTANSAGGGTVVLTKDCTYTLTTSHGSDADGPDGLPIITTAITLSGNNNIITRSTAVGTLPFRIAKVASTGSLTLKGDITLSNGLAGTDGGGILNHGTVTLTKSALTGNTALGKGGGLSNTDISEPATGATATFTGSIVSNNTAIGRGGGIYNGLRSTLTTTSSFVNGTNSGSQGGGIAAIESTATTLTSTPISTNHATSNAGGVYRLGGTMTVTSSPISGNTPNNCTGSTPAVPSCTD
ncbi:right-handed parallel beta-helix repeat-containing protein [Streptomyces halobius]|uniref:Right-handed parallel beta-helix repeat-containing protein n=1 Tax=Streptomyces halobius TaxID=2879846 RepID=A0ABY4M124_9ACTN|nr:right-handed parallel beta-helix repeat-containing protein [Streptomyces halobius]UQA91452.1 right-handed parallel beta-helix repeat-containing protein [Streptomyces halobius]